MNELERWIGRVVPEEDMVDGGVPLRHLRVERGDDRGAREVGCRSQVRVTAENRKSALMRPVRSSYRRAARR